MVATTTVRIAGHEIGPGRPAFIIAEAGVNHNGDTNVAVELVRRAAACGANCVKFQTFRAARVASRDAAKAHYQTKVTDPSESQFAMLEKLELSEEAHRIVLEECRAQGVTFLSTPYSIEDAVFLDDLGVPAFKIASGQIVEFPFLAKLARMGRPLLVSTGMCSLAEIMDAVQVIRKNGNPPLVLLQCTTNYPSSLDDTNLRAMQTIATSTGCLVGYSDHTEGIVASLAAVALGACIVEKHFTLSRSLPGPDHTSSVEPSELLALVKGVREVETALGSATKKPTSSELKNRNEVRRSIAAAVDIAPGQTIHEADLQLLRPGTGLSPMHWESVVGRQARCAIAKGTLLDWSILS